MADASMSRSTKIKTSSEKAPVPSVNWAIAASKFSKDAESGSPSALFMIEDFDLPKELFERAKVEFVSSNKPFEMMFVVDWRWPVEITSKEDVPFKLVWVTPSGKRFAGGADVDAISRPTSQNRAKVVVKLDGVPVQDEGVYFFDVMLNDESKFRYPIRLRCSESKPDKVKKVPSKKAPRTRIKKKSTPELND